MKGTIIVVVQGSDHDYFNAVFLQADPVFSFNPGIGYHRIDVCYRTN